jgi:4-amino-4-deoxy-L-arabinose transferase-like glycosyltransferase
VSARLHAAPNWLALAALAGLALLLRLGLIADTRHFVFINDPLDYENRAASLALGHGYGPTGLASPGTPSAFRPPAYPFLLAAAYAVFGVHPELGRVVAALLGTVTVVLVAALGTALWDRRIGWAAGVVAAVFPSLIALNGTLLSESLFLPLELTIGLALISIARGNRGVVPAAGIGALCGVAALTRTVGILFLLPACVAFLRSDLSRRRRLARCGVVVVSCCLVLAPWAIRNAVVLHAFVPLNTQAGPTLAGEYNDVAGGGGSLEADWRAFPHQTPQLAAQMAHLYYRRGGVDEVQLDHALTRAAVHYAEQHPGYVLAALGLNTLRMFDLGPGHTFVTTYAYDELNLPEALRAPADLAVLLALALAGVGLLARVARLIPAAARGAWLVWSLPLLAFLATIPTDGTPRYRTILDPFLVLAATATVDQLARRWTRRPSRHRQAGSIV